MSKTVDERVVEMRFDNKQFESNVKTSISTLDKLKQKLNLPGASKGLENIESAAKKVDINPLGKAAETVTAKFSALQVIGVTALANITNSAVNAGKNIISALTIDPVKTGFQEYTTQLTATQSILANVGSKGKTIDDVNAALDKLNKYADQTIYNFTEMTRNIGYFTTAGVDLDQSVTAIKGFSNAAALAGADATKTAGAMYQLSQAMSSGKMLLMDWRSLEQAGIAGEKFKNAIIDTAKVHGINVDKMIEEQGSFRDTLKDGWLTNDIMVESLEKFTMATDGLTDAEVKANREKLRSIGYTEEQIDSIFELGQVATDSATKVKDIGQMWDVIKEAAQSGWAQTWRLIFGDVEEAKALFTPLTNFFTNIIDKMSTARNKLLDSALGRSFKSLSEKISSVLTPVEKTSDAIKKVTDAVKDYGKVVDEIISGSWGNGQSRWNKLTEAGYDWAHAQNLVNERLNDSTRHATNYKEVQEQTIETQAKLTESDSDRIEQLASLSEAQLRNLGYTDEQIAAFKELRSTADKLGLPISEFIKNIDEINGRWLLINSFKNIGKGIVTVITSIKDAWRDIFPATTAEQLFNIIAGFHKLTTHLIVSDETADKVKRTFKGLFAALDLVRTVVSGALGIGFKVLKEVLYAFDLDILDVTAHVGDAIVKFRDWVKEHDLLSKVIQTIVPYIKEAVTAVSEWIKNNETIQNGIDKLTSIFDKATSGIRKWIDGLKETDDIPGYIISGLANGLKSGISIITDIISELGKCILDTIKKILGIHSPSTEFFEIGKNIILGLINGLKDGLSSLLTFLGEIGKKCIEEIGNIDFGKVFAIGISAGIVYFGKKMLDILENFSSPFRSISGMFSKIGMFFTMFGQGLNKNLKAKALENKSKALRNLAISIGILTASIYLLAKLDSDKLWNGVKAITALAGVMVALLAVSSLFSKYGTNIDGNLNVSKLVLSLLGISASIFILSSAIKKLEFLNKDNMGPILTALTTMFVGLAGLIAFVGNFPNIEKAGNNIYKMSGAMLIMVGIIKLVSGMSVGEIAKGLFAITAFGGIMVGLTYLTKLAGKNIDKVGGTLLKMSAAMLLMVIVVKSISGLDVGEITKGIICMRLFGGLMAGLIAITRLSSGNTKGIGSTLLGMSSSLLIMVVITKMVSGMSVGEIAKGVVCITLFGGIIAGLVAATRLAGEGELKRIASTLLAMSLSIGILAATAVVLGLIDTKSLAKGIIAVTMLSSIMAIMVRSTKDAQNCKSTIIAMTVAIGVMALAVAALSFIDPNQLFGATAALSLLMGMFGVMAKLAGSAKASIGSLMIMSVAVGLLAGIIYLLSGLPIESVLASAASLSVLLLSMSASLAILSIVGVSIGTALAGALGLLALCVPLVAFVGTLALMQNIQNAMSNAIVLAAFATVMTGLLVVLTGIGVIYMGTGGIAATGILGLLAMAVPLIAFVGILAMMQGIQNAEANANILISLMTTMTGMLTVISLLGPLALIGVGAITAMTVVMTAIAGLVVAIGALNEKFPQLETFVDSGISLLIKLANGLGQVIGNFVSGFAQGFTSGLPEIATNLSTFMANLTPFIAGAKMLDESTITNVKTLVSIIGELTKISIFEGIASWFGIGGNTLIDFANQLVPFGTAMMAFSTTVKGIDEGAVTAAANAGKMMAEMAKTIPREGSIWEKIAGEKDLISFGNKIVAFGSAIKSFSLTLTTGGPIDEAAVTAAANAGKQMAEMANSMPKEGGLWQKVAGSKDIAKFGEKIVAYSESVGKFSDKIKNLTIDEGRITSAINAGKQMIEFSKVLPKDGGWWQKIAGSKDMSSFGEKTASFGESISTFSDKVSNIKFKAIDSTAAAIEKIINMAKSVEGADISSLSTFTSSLDKVGKSGVDKFIKAFSDSSGNAVNAGRNLVSKVVEGIQSGLPMLNISFAPVIQNMLSYAITSIKNYHIQFAIAGLHLVNGFAKGINDNTFIAEAKARAMANKAYEAAKKALDEHSPSKKFMKVGAFVVAGFAKGITKNIGDATKAAIGMSNGVLEATQDALGIHSPSIVFSKEVGRYIVKGIADGIKKDMSAEEAAEKKAQNIVNAFKKELDKYDLDVATSEKEFSLWKLNEGKNASDIAVTEKNINVLTSKFKTLSEKSNLAHDEWQETISKIGENSEEAHTALNKYLDALIEVGNVSEEINSLQLSIFDSKIEALDQDSSTLDKEFELWKYNEGKNASNLDVIKKNIEINVSKFKILNDKSNEEYSKWLKIVESKGENSKEAKEQLNKYRDVLNEIGNLSSEIEDLEDSIFDEKNEAIEKRKSNRDKDKELWELTYGDDTTDRNKYLYYKNKIREDIADDQQEFLNAIEYYNYCLDKYGREADKTKNAWEKVRDSQIALAEDQKELNDNLKDYQEKQKESLKDQYELASDNADLRYQIWEKTLGRDAKDEEKNAKKLIFLSEQMAAQAKLVQLAEKEWREASADNKQSKEKEYLNAQLELANLQSEILDIQEENIKRQETALEKQRNARVEYEDYIKKYEKYYLDHGMTKAELEKDARLVAGYDLNNAVKSMISKTSNALDNLKNNTQYDSLLSSFSNMGSSYTTAISEGIQNGTNTVMDTTSTMIKTCVEKINSEKDSWRKAGETLVENFISGIKSKIQDSVNIATELASRTLSAIRNICESDMEYSPTIRPVLDMSDVSSKVSGLNSVLSGNRSLSLASSISSGTTNNGYNAYGQSNPVTPTYTLTQYNYSPKALSSIEIYRQTNNLISKIGKKVT